MYIYHPVTDKIYKQGDDSHLYDWNNTKRNLNYMSEGQPIAPMLPFTYQLMVEAPLKVQTNRAILYGNPRGEEKFLSILADSYSKDFDMNIKTENLVFTNGITQGLKLLGGYIDNNITNDDYAFETIPGYIYFNEFSKKSKNIIHTFEDFNFKHDKFSKLLVNAKNISKILKRHNLDKSENFCKLKYIFLVNPTNPLGQYIKPADWMEIIPILQRYDKAIIILDEAYSDMTFKDDFISLMKIAPEDLKKRIILFRTGSKSLSIAGERIGVAISLNKEIIHYMVTKQLENQIHVSLTSQYIFAKTIEYITTNPEKKRYSIEFYKDGIKKLNDLAKRHDIKSNHLDFEQTAGIFIFLDLKKLIGLKMNLKASSNVYHLKESKIIENDLDIYYHLLFEYNFVLLKPGSCYGFPSEECIFRVSVNEDKSIELLDEILTDINKRL